MKQFGLILGVTAILAASSHVSASDYYRWTDDKGTTHITAEPPKGVDKVEKVHVTGTATRYDANQEQAETPEAKKDQETKAKVEDLAKRRAEKDRADCEQAREYHKTLTERDRVRIKDDDGTEHYLSPEEQQAKIDETQKFIDETCAGQ